LPPTWPGSGCIRDLKHFGSTKTSDSNYFHDNSTANATLSDIYYSLLPRNSSENENELMML
jgi:hypothetical protein